MTASAPPSTGRVRGLSPPVGNRPPQRTHPSLKIPNTIPPPLRISKPPRRRAARMAAGRGHGAWFAGARSRPNLRESRKASLIIEPRQTFPFARNSKRMRRSGFGIRPLSFPLAYRLVSHGKCAHVQPAYSPTGLRERPSGVARHPLLVGDIATHGRAVATALP